MKQSGQSEKDVHDPRCSRDQSYRERNSFTEREICKNFKNGSRWQTRFCGIPPAMLKEISLVLNYRKIIKFLAKRSVTSEAIKDALQRIVKTAIMVSGKAEISRIDKDPADVIVLSCAVEGHAYFIISGDHHLTDLASFEGISIVNPNTFLKLTEGRS
jgi:putative PIN family toxin of toxin-antitoxin system